MKKILYSAALSAILIAGAGCSKKDLDLFPYNTVATEQAFNTQTDVTYDLNGMYAGLKTSTSYFVSGPWNILADVLGDNLVLDQQGRQSLKTPYYTYTYSSASTYGLFSGGYTIIRRANAILENIGNFPAGSFKNDAMGQAYALRALVYFDMVRVYSKTYLNASASDYTMPYVTTTAATNLPGSEPVQGFYNKIIADLVTAEGLINPAATNNNGNITLNREAVAGLLSRVYLYKGDYANCILEANKAIGATNPTLPNATVFPGIWTDATSSGVLFKVKNTNIDNINTQGTNYFQLVAAGPKSEYVVDYTFYQMFTEDPTAVDVRKATYINTTNYNGATLYNNVAKYPTRTGSPAGVLDGKVIRSAEVFLNKIESEYRTGATGPALTDLIYFKSNRYVPYTGTTLATADLALSGTALLNEILKQRRLELAFEGDRFWDLKRLNLPVQRDGVHGDKADGTGTPPGVPTLAAGDYRFQLPYPQSEIIFNPAIKQNPNYN